MNMEMKILAFTVHIVVGDENAFLGLVCLEYKCIWPVFCSFSNLNHFQNLF